MARDPIGDYLNRRVRYYDYKRIRAEDKENERRAAAAFRAKYEEWTKEPGRVEEELRNEALGGVVLRGVFVGGLAMVVTCMFPSLYFLLALVVLFVVYDYENSVSVAENWISRFENIKAAGRRGR